MTDLSVPHVVATTAPSRTPGPIDRIARDLVMRRLESLNHGRITIEDAVGTTVFGPDQADGSTLRASLRVNDPRFYRRALFGGSLGAASAYLDGFWDCDDLTSLLRVFVRNDQVTDSMEQGAAWLTLPVRRLFHLLRRNSVTGSRRNIHAHYDLGNEFFSLFLDESLTYSCALFDTPETSLYDASIAKLDRICHKLDLRPGHHVVEIGCGWGSFALHAAKHYGCRVTTTTISDEQYELARKRVRDAGLEHRVTVLKQDYRTLTGHFDRLVSIEMIEAVGHRYLPAFFETCGSLLKPDGEMLIQAITMPDQRYDRYRLSVDFIQRFVFPGSCCPSLTAMMSAMRRRTDLKVVHLEDLTPHYATTLRTWRQRFRDRVQDVRRLGFPERFLRLWDYYFCYCEAGFAERYIGNVQLLLRRPLNRSRPLLPSLNDQTTQGDSYACPAAHG